MSLCFEYGLRRPAGKRTAALLGLALLAGGVPARSLVQPAEDEAFLDALLAERGVFGDIPAP